MCLPLYMCREIPKCVSAMFPYSVIVVRPSRATKVQIFQACGSDDSVCDRQRDVRRWSYIDSSLTALQQHLERDCFVKPPRLPGAIVLPWATNLPRATSSDLRELTYNPKHDLWCNVLCWHVAQTCADQEAAAKFKDLMDALAGQKMFCDIRVPSQNLWEGGFGSDKKHEQSSCASLFVPQTFSMTPPCQAV